MYAIYIGFLGGSVVKNPPPLRASLEVLVGERSYSYTLDQTLVLLYGG